MTDAEITIAVAELAGVKYHKPTGAELMSGSYHQYEPDYLNSRDATIYVIKKYWKGLFKNSESTLESEGFLVLLGEICEQLCHDEAAWSITPFYRLVLINPRTLCIALLKATGKYKL